MNTRFRQRSRANKMLDKHDPPMMASVPIEGEKFNRLLVFRRSQYERYKELYGDKMDVFVGDIDGEREMD